MPLQATSGAASYDAFGGGVAAVPNYIEDVFSTWLYTGTGGNTSFVYQNIVNNIDLAGKGGLVWIKKRAFTSTFSGEHALFDTARGAARRLVTNRTNAQDGDGVYTYMSSFNSNGFTVNNIEDYANQYYTTQTNWSPDPYASWTFRKQPKFFDVVTWSGDGVAGRQISHALGSVPGCIIIKRTDTTSDWAVYHRGLTAPAAERWIKLNTTAAETGADSPWSDTAPTSTNFTVNASAPVNASGGTYVAYLFAHNAGGFGLTGTDNVISCGSFTQASGGTTVNLGFEPQWVMVKNSSGTGNWFIFDNMRGNTVTLYPNLANAEGDQGSGSFQYNATGFTMADYITGSVGSTLIYIAIRRGPMRTPTTGTSVFESIASSASTGTAQTTGFPVDMQIAGLRTVAGSCDHYVDDRLRGVSSTTTEQGRFLKTNATDAEATTLNLTRNWGNTGFQIPSDLAGSSSIYWNFRRAPGFFDEVCYTGTGSARTVAHNLGVVPELMIVKRRSGVADWPVYSSAVGNTKFLLLNSTGDTITDNVWNNTTPTATEFSVRDQNTVNASGSTYVAYLFATVAGVSKVGSYTGTGTTQVIDCGFTSGARFVLIKRSSGTGDWYVWDSARGIVAGNDPYLLLNSTAAEVTNTDFIDTASTGFEISSTAPAAINASGGTFIFLAIA